MIFTMLWDSCKTVTKIGVRMRRSVIEDAKRVVGTVVGITLAIGLCSGVANATSEKSSKPNSSVLQISLKRTDGLKDNVQLNSRLTYTVTYTNKGSQPITAYPYESNISDIRVGDSNNCRWANLKPGETQQCGFGYHVVTEEDAKAGKFTPKTVWKVSKDRDGNQIIENNIVVEDKPVTGIKNTEFDSSLGLKTVKLTTRTNSVCYRIPAITQTANGWILAAYDKRPGNCSDAPMPNSIVQRISKDGGKTFEAETVVKQGHYGDENTRWGYSDPSYVLDRETNEIFLFSVKSYRNGWGGSSAGVDPENRNVLHASVTSSKDNGVTWSTPKIITKDVTADVGHWSSRFAASGHGIQLRHGKYKGRLLQQYTINNSRRIQAVTVYSDDHGKTWKVGKPVGFRSEKSHMDENKVVELSDGRVMLNSRPQNFRHRLVAISNDGGETYGEVKEEMQLPDPANNAQITRAYPDAPMGSPEAKVLVYSSSSAYGRSDGLIRVSFDDGATWDTGKLFKSGPMAYSCIEVLNKQHGGGFGLLYEGDNSNIIYTHISEDWLGYTPVTADNSVIDVPKNAKNIEVKIKNLGSHDYSDLKLSMKDLGKQSELNKDWKIQDKTGISVKPFANANIKLDIAMPKDVKEGTTVSIPVRFASAKYAVGDSLPGIQSVINIRVVKAVESHSVVPSAPSVDVKPSVDTPSAEKPSAENPSQNPPSETITPTEPSQNPAPAREQAPQVSNQSRNEANTQKADEQKSEQKKEDSKAKYDVVPAPPASVDQLDKSLKGAITVGNNNQIVAGEPVKISGKISNKEFAQQLQKNGSAKAYAFIYSTPKALKDSDGNSFITVRGSADNAQFSIDIPDGYSGKHTIVLVNEKGEQLAWNEVTVSANPVADKKDSSSEKSDLNRNAFSKVSTGSSMLIVLAVVMLLGTAGFFAKAMRNKIA